MVGEVGGGSGPDVLFLRAVRVGRRVVCFFLGMGEFESPVLGDVDNTDHVVAMHVVVDGGDTVRPFACGRVGAEEEHGDGDGDDEDAGYDEGNAPCDVLRFVLVLDETVVDGGHDEIGDAAAGVAEPRSEGIGGAHHVFVVETGRPDLAGDKGAPEDTNEEANGIQTRDILHAPSAERGDGAGKESGSERLAGTKAITARATDEPN